VFKARPFVQYSGFDRLKNRQHRSIMVVVRVKPEIVYIAVEILLDLPNKQLKLNIDSIHCEIGG
jgi:hypothetical protein